MGATFRIQRPDELWQEVSIGPEHARAHALVGPGTDGDAWMDMEDRG